MKKMTKYRDKRIIAAVVILLMAGGFGLVRWFVNQPLNMDLPKEFSFGGAAIVLAWTDDNSGENLIIQSDKKEYQGFSSAEVYFSITNISRRAQDMDIVFWLEDGTRKVERVEWLDTEEGKETALDVRKVPMVIPDLNSRAVLQKGLSSGDSEERGLPFLKGDPRNSANTRAVLDDKGRPLREGRKSVKGFTDGYAAKDKIQSGETRYYKALLKYPARVSGEFFIEAFGNNGGYGHLDPWYSSSWLYKRAITLDHNQITTTTDAFPVLATTTADYLKYTDQANGKIANIDAYDLIFVDDDDETLLKFEREKHNTTTGEIAYWIKTDISSTTDKTIYMYYGNSGASDLATTTGVWDDNYVMVNHLAHDGVATTTYPDFNDSTKYNNDGSSKNMNSDDLVDGQIDGSLDFDGGDDYVDAGSNASLEITEDLTLMAWIYRKDTGSGSLFDFSADSENEADNILYRVIINDDINPDEYQYINEYGSGTNEIVDLNRVSGNTPNNQWVHFVFIRNSTDLFIYEDGSQVGSGSFTNTPTGGTTSLLSIGKENTGSGTYFNGLIDEVRISNVARTAGWIETEYNNQVSVGDFMAFGAETGLPADPVERSGSENVKTRIKGGVRIKGGTRF